uniref:Two component, sigma54 specific, transcriptional regulator, Fis family n=1 Tax=uncultured bacterium contig00069 TaxID=1181550 RepID=A0A806JZN4_9BACT|nr:two component, sigma54 specific, transcriptional regulator, Fis family [uncultured bacterium contig00069]
MDKDLSFKKMLQIAADSDLPVLITGESGVGKDIAARQLHALGERKGSPFIAVNCGAVSIGIANSLFCGHVRGAFTGANTNQQGFIRAANGGTLFLDEVAELSLENQKTLLRALQEKTVMPVGSQKEIGVDFRLICATHRDLSLLVERGLFRQDLYFRLAILPINIPPLRERTDLREIANSIWQHPEPLSERNMRTLQGYSWPGNVRQLKNVLERYALFKGYGYSLEYIISTESEQCKFCLREPMPKYRPDASKIKEEIETNNGNKSHAAKKLGISRGSLYYQMRKR